MPRYEDDIDRALAALGAIPLKRYCQITGETPTAVYQRRIHGVWERGREMVKPEGGGGWWIVLPAVQRWVLAELRMDLHEVLHQTIEKEGRRDGALEDRG